MKEMRRKQGRRLMLTGLVLIISALFLLVYNIVQDQQAGQAASLALEGVKREILESGNPQGMLDKANKKEETIRYIDGYPYLGYLNIPSLEMEWPIISDWSYEALRLTPNRHFGSYITGDMVLAGHNNMMHFGRLVELDIGDLILFTDMDGDVYFYKVNMIDNLDPSQSQVIADSGSNLTLYTCTYSRYKRVTIFTRLLEDYELGDIEF